MFRPSLMTALLFGLLLLAGPVSQAAKVKVWSHHGASDYDKAQLKHAVVTSEGALRLARRLRPLADLKATHVWDVVEDRAGNLFVATGDEGKLYKVTAEGTVSVVYTSADSQVLCLALAPDGTLYAGTGPTGLIVALAPSTGKARIVAEDLDSYVWCLALHADGKTLYAGTGPKGHIYQVLPDGTTSVFYTTKQEHILCLARGPEGVLYAGTDKGGVVYRIDARGKGFVLYQTAQAEVRSLLVSADGLYAGTSAPTRRQSGSHTASRGSGSFSPLSAGEAPTTADKKTGENKVHRDSAVKPASTASAAAAATDEEKSETKASTAAAPPPPATGENSVYRIAADGTVRELFREKAMVLSLVRQHGTLLVGTGMQGQLFAIDEASKERSEIARLDNGQIHCLCQRRDGSVVLGTGDPGRLYVLEDSFAARGTVTSEVLDAKIISRWGALTWSADTPPGTAVTVAVRTGNVAEPDDTWSDWSAEQTDARQAKVAAPPARFLQYRVTLTSDSPRASPAVRGVAVRYKTTNQAPEVTKIEVPDTDTGSLDGKKLKLKWTVQDPNEDELTFRLLVRKEGWKDWVCLEEELEKKEYEWDAGGMPSGVYQVKVVASDRRDNPEDEALTGERISVPFPVTHQPPAVSVKVAGIEEDRAVIEATARDPLVRLTEAGFAVNGKKWVNVFPSDGLFDARSESFRFKTAPLRPGTYVLVLRVRNAAGVVGSADVVFTVRARPAP
jgi:outer membrane protein assembly factor BamB